MIIGIPTEVKNLEYRVGMTPSGVAQAVKRGHDVVVQSHAGAEMGYPDEAYTNAGATIAPTADAIYDTADMIVKVKEIQPCEYDKICRGQILFHYAHLMPKLNHAQTIVDSGCVTIAYENTMDARGHLPLLAPMSEIAGCMAIQVGAEYLQKKNGGSGVLLSGFLGVPPAKVTIIGAGSVGENAVRMAVGAGADVTVVNRGTKRLKHLKTLYPTIKTASSTPHVIAELVRQSDLVVGAVLVSGQVTPQLVTHEMIKTMQKGSVIVDVGIDMGGCFATSHPTTHDDPVFVVDGIIHYCVPNMPGLVPKTATQALTNASLPFALELADKGWQRACLENITLANGLNCAMGQVTHSKIADFMKRNHTPLETLIQRGISS